MSQKDYEAISPYLYTSNDQNINTSPVRNKYKYMVDLQNKQKNATQQALSAGLKSAVGVALQGDENYGALSTDS